MEDIDIKKLLSDVFNGYAYGNIVKDFKFMAQYSSLKDDPGIMKLCMLWFALGHINTMDKKSTFNTHYNGENTNGNTDQ